MSKPVLLYYGRRGHELAGAVRAIAIANLLSDRFRVMMLNGVSLPARMIVSPDVEFIEVPGITVDFPDDGSGTGGAAMSAQESSVRQELMLQKYSELEPAVLLIENFPFAGNSADELMPVIREARSAGIHRPLIVCGLTDVMWGARHDEGDHDEIAALLDHYFDALLVHSDPAFARLEEFFQPSAALNVPVHHTGFVLRQRQSRAGHRQRRILVSASDGHAGGRLYGAAIEAHRLLWEIDRLRMTIVAGPSLPDDEWRALAEAASGEPALTLERSVADLGAELAKVRWVVCQCGYNTMCEVIASGVSALFVPDMEADGTIQIDRGQRLTRLGVGRMMAPQHINGASLASGIHQLLRFRPAGNGFDLDGARLSADLIHQMVVARRAGASLLEPKLEPDLGSEGGQ